MINEDFVILPFWVEQALQRNGYSNIDCFDYVKVRQVLSLEDMAGFLAAQDIPTLTNIESFNGTLLNKWTGNTKGDDLVELNSTIIPLSHSNELKKEIIDRLSEDSKLLYCTYDESVIPTYYKVVDAGQSTLILVVYCGYPQYIAKPENMYKVIVEQIRLFYVYLKCNQVSQLPIFKKYLSLLKMKLTSPLTA